MRPGSFARRNSSAVRLRRVRFRNRHTEQHSPRSPQTTDELNEALKAFDERLPTVSAQGEEDGSPRRVAAPAADDAPPPPFLSSAWPAERAQQRAFLAQTAASWSLIALVLAAYVQLLSAMGRGEAVFLALRPWLGVSKARACRSVRACRAGAQLRRDAQMFILGGGLTAALAYITDISLWPERFFPLRLLVGAVAFALFGFGVFFNAYEVRASGRPRLGTRADCLQLQQADAPHLFMALALPFLQAVLKKFILHKAPLLNFMRALAYGFAIAGAILNATFVGWLLLDKSRRFNVLVPALCARMQLKTVRPLACQAPWPTLAATTPRYVLLSHRLRMSRAPCVLVLLSRGLRRPSRAAGASSSLASPCSSAARTKKPGAAPPRSFCRLRCVPALPCVDMECLQPVHVRARRCSLPCCAAGQQHKSGRFRCGLQTPCKCSAAPDSPPPE